MGFASDNPLHEMGISLPDKQGIRAEKGIRPGWHSKLNSEHNDKDNLHVEIYGAGKIHIAYQSGIVISDTRRKKVSHQKTSLWPAMLGSDTQTTHLSIGA